MKSIRVFIATTDGPAEVQRIAEEDPDVKSVVCLDGKAVALPISPDYDAFVRAPTGVIERSYGHRAFRLDVSREISSGLSWQLGIFIAHALHVAGRLAEDGTTADSNVGGDPLQYEAARDARDCSTRDRRGPECTFLRSDE